MPKKMIFIFILGFAPGLGFIGWNLFSIKTPISDELMTREYVQYFFKKYCKLDFVHEFRGKGEANPISGEAEKCTDLFFHHMDDLMAKGYSLPTVDQAWEKCGDDCHSISDLEKFIAKNRQSLKSEKD